MSQIDLASKFVKKLPALTLTNSPTGAGDTAIDAFGKLQAQISSVITDNTRFTYVQSSVSTIWTVPHNLNRHPRVTVVDNLGNVLLSDVSYVDINTIQVVHGTAITGTVYCD